MDAAKTKPFNIDKKSVYDAYKAVRANAGAAGVDGQSLEMFDKDLMRNLYKIWNRMSSGSYFPASWAPSQGAACTLDNGLSISAEDARREPSGAAFTVAALSRRSAGMTRQTRGPRVHDRWAHLRLCGAPHKRSYAERMIMRRPRRELPPAGFSRKSHSA